MPVKKRITEQLKLENVVESQALGDATVTGDYKDMQNARQAVFLLNSGALADTNNITMEIMQAEDASGTNEKALTDLDGNAITVEHTNSTGASVDKVQLIADVRASLMDEGFNYLSVRVTSDDAASNIAVDALLGNTIRFMPDQAQADAIVVE